MSTIDEINELVRQYQSWMKDCTPLRPAYQGWVQVTTPFLDRHNDGIQIYVRKDGDRVTISDQGETLDDLEASGLDLSSSAKRQAELETILNINGIVNHDGVLSVSTSVGDFPTRKSAMINAIMRMNDLAMLSHSSVANVFMEDVRNWMRENSLKAIESVPLRGSTGYEYTADFIFPSLPGGSMRILQLLPKPTKQNVAMIVMMNGDIQRSHAMSVLIDDSSATADAIEKADAKLVQHSVSPFKWSDRARCVAQFC